MDSGYWFGQILRHPILQPEVSALIDMEHISLRSLLERMDREVKGIADFYNFSFPSAEVFRENLLRATIDLSRKNTEYHFHEAELQKKSRVADNAEKKYGRSLQKS